MAKYATTEETWQCWGCGVDITLREMWSTEDRPQVKRCPNCKENILVVKDGVIDRAAAYWNDPRFHPLANP